MTSPKLSHPFQLEGCLDHARSIGDMAIEIGSQRRTREIIAWSRRRRTIRREELLAFLAGRSPPPKSLYR